MSFPQQKQLIERLYSVFKHIFSGKFPLVCNSKIPFYESKSDPKEVVAHNV